MVELRRPVGLPAGRLFVRDSRHKVLRSTKGTAGRLMSEHWVADDRPTWAEVDLDALAWNYRAVCGRVGEGVKVMGVVKADAYGHGAPECARRLAAEGAEWFGVATPEEAFELRRAGVEQNVLSFG